MIGDIGIIIGLYALVRLCEILMSAENRYNSKSAMVAAKVAATLGLVAILFLTGDVIMNAVSGQSPFNTQIQGPEIFKPPAPRPLPR
jgi:hypothetical protein